jgi:hypothetical protein
MKKMLQVKKTAMQLTKEDRVSLVFMCGKEGCPPCARLLPEVPDKNFVLYKIQLISSYRSVNVTVSISASKLVANNLNICLNQDDSTVNPMGRHIWPTLYMAKITQNPPKVQYN